MKQLVIMIPTYNRPDSIKFYLEKVLDALIRYNIDLIICDSSTEDKTKEIVEKKVGKSSGHLFYKRYPSSLYEEKVYQAIDGIKKEYTYLWICSDSYVLNIEELYGDIAKYMQEDLDIIHIDELDRDGIGNKKYTDCKELFKECFFRMLLYGGTIINNRVFDTILNRTIFEKYSGTGLYYQSSLMEYCARNSFIAVRYYNKRHYTINQYKTKSEWAGRAVWQWSENWYNVVQKLPDIYNEYKPKVLKSSEMFSLVGLVRLRYFGGLTFKEVHKYESYIKKTSRSNIALVYAICLIPIPLITGPRKLYRLVKSAKKNV